MITFLLQSYQSNPAEMKSPSEEQLDFSMDSLSATFHVFRNRALFSSSVGNWEYRQ